MISIRIAIQEKGERPLVTLNIVGDHVHVNSFIMYMVFY